MRFIGRTKELETLRSALMDEETKAVLVIGRRRMGKTRLIKEALSGLDCTSVVYRCKEQASARSVEEISRLVTGTLGPVIAFPSFEALFSYLGTFKQKIIIAIDEYQDMRMLEGTYVDSLLRNAMDDMPSNIRIVLSGSAIRVMKELEKNTNPLYGRFKATVEVGEMDYIDAAAFLPALPTRDKLMFYSVFGGVPWLLESIDGQLSVEENIIRLFVEAKGLARGYAGDVLEVECASIAYASEVFHAIRNGKKRFSDILSYIAVESGRTQLARTLKAMLEAGLLIKRHPINNDSPKATFYEVSGNAMRFYLAYQDALLDENNVNPSTVFKSLIAPSLDTFASYRFEDVVRSYFKRLSLSGKREDILRIGSYWYDDRKTRRNGEFDVALQLVDGSYEIYECKFLKKAATRQLIEDERSKLGGIPLVGVRHFGMVSSAGFECEAFDDVILLSGDDLYRLP